MFKFDFSTMTLVGIAGIVLVVTALAAVSSIFTIYSVNTLFGTSWQYDFPTIISLMWLNILIGSFIKGAKS